MSFTATGYCPFLQSIHFPRNFFRPSCKVGLIAYFIDKIEGSLFYKGSQYFIESGHYSILNNDRGLLFYGGHFTTLHRQMALNLNNKMNIKLKYILNMW